MRMGRDYKVDKIRTLKELSGRVVDDNELKGDISEEIGFLKGVASAEESMVNMAKIIEELVKTSNKKDVIIVLIGLGFALSVSINIYNYFKQRPIEIHHANDLSAEEIELITSMRKGK